MYFAPTNACMKIDISKSLNVIQTKSKQSLIIVGSMMPVSNTSFSNSDFQTTNSRRYTVLVVEDEAALAEAIELYLRNEGYKTERASDGERALELFQFAQPDLVILDIGLPKLDGIEVLKRIRIKSTTPVIMLTARSEEVDELLGLGLGADDYVTKPASPRKLMARVKAVLKRSVAPVSESERIRIGAVDIDVYGMKASFDNQEIPLTPSEFRMLHHLALTPGRAIERLELLEVAMPDSDALERAVDIHMTNLRRKLKEAGADDIIETVRGMGYRLKTPY